MNNEIKNAEKYLQGLLLNGKISVEEVQKMVANLISHSEIEVGWYAFAGEKFSPYPKAYPNCQGVVGWLNPDKNAPKGQRGLIVTPDQFIGAWSDEYCYIGAYDEEDGKSNTEKQLAYGREHQVSFPAAEWCAQYDKNGVQPGEGFSPAWRQLQRIVDNGTIVNPSIEKIGGQKLSGWLLSSSECSNNYVWLVGASNGNTLTDYKDCNYGYVRCVLAF